MIVNVFIAVSDVARTRIVERLRWDEETQGEYTGPITNEQYRLFSYMQDQRNREALFKRPTIAGREYVLFSVDFDGDQVPLNRVRQVLDDLVASYPNQIAVMGAWDVETGAQVGYPIHAQLWRFMPNRIGATSNADLVDINLLYGQAPRDYT